MRPVHQSSTCWAGTSRCFVPGDFLPIDFYPATIGATLNVDNNSLYFQDHWAINGRWSVDLGARYEHVTAVSSGDIPGVRTTAWCRAWAPRGTCKGNGSHIVP